MRKNGFTLIELLAVIIILAVIALIATPIVLNVIDSAKKSAAASSVNGYIDAVKLARIEYMFDNSSSAEPSFSDLGTITVQGDTPDCGDGELVNGVFVSEDDFCVINGYTCTVTDGIAKAENCEKGTGETISID